MLHVAIGLRAPTKSRLHDHGRKRLNLRKFHFLVSTLLYYRLFHWLTIEHEAKRQLHNLLPAFNAVKTFFERVANYVLRGLNPIAVRSRAIFCSLLSRYRRLRTNRCTNNNADYWGGHDVDLRTIIQRYISKVQLLVQIEWALGWSGQLQSTTVRSVRSLTDGVLFEVNETERRMKHDKNIY